MRSLRAALAASLAILALLAGCSDDEPSPGDPSSTWTPTSEPETPTSSATAKPTEPRLPDAATKATEDGARAFIAYYWDLVNYAQVTGDVKALKRASGSTCDGCSRAIDAVEQLYGSGGHAEGGEYVLRIVRIKELTSKDQALYGMEAVLEARNAPQRIVRDGDVELSEPRTSRFTTYTIWVDEAWRTDILEPR
jgi:hypothetical protein